MSVGSNAIVTYDEVMDFAESSGYVDKSVDNTLLENIINYKTQEFQTYCDIEQFKSRQYTERYDGNNTSRLFTSKYPIISVSTIYDDTAWGFGESTLIDSSNYVIHNSKKFIQFLDTYVLSTGTQNIKITYTAGYATIPDDIKLACIKEVMRDFSRRSDFDVTAKTLDDGTVSYVEKGLMKSTKEVLDKYKYIGIA